MMPPEITADQRKEIQLAALGVADKAMKLAAFPSLINDKQFMAFMQKDIKRIEAIHENK